jgi:NadR type nicotinamide-nucleotide adenylyltransferase
MLKIAVTGPESSGKSTLCAALAAHYHTSWVPEYARYFLTHLPREYEQADLLTIARRQMEWERRYARKAKDVLFCDTELLVIKIWSEVKYGRVDPWITAAYQRRKYPLFLLCTPDIPWIGDPLREHPNAADRAALYQRYRDELVVKGANFVVISGADQELRLQQAISAVDLEIARKTE